MSQATPQPEGASLQLKLRRAARRLGWTQGLRHAVWAAFGALWASELALLVGGPLGAVGWVVAAGLVLYAGSRLQRIEPRLAAAVADARLGSCAVSSGAEVLSGQHPRFGPAATREALRALDGLPLARWAPWRAPAGWPLGLLIAVLLPLAWLSQAGSAQAQPSRRLPGLLDPSQVAAAGGGGAANGADDPGLLGWAEDVDGVAWSELAPEVAAVLREELTAGGAPSAADGGGATSSAGEPEASEPGASDAGTLNAWAEALQAAAAAGDRAAQATLAALEDAAGAGAGDPADPATSQGPLAGTDPGATIRFDSTRRAQVTWALRTAERRYFNRNPTGR